MPYDQQYGFFQDLTSVTTHATQSIAQYVSDAYRCASEVYANNETLETFLNDYYLVPVFCVAGIGSAVVPHFALGLAVGVLSLAIQQLQLIFLGSMGFDINPNFSQKYRDLLENERFWTTLGAPICEEIIHRLLIQQVFFLVIFNVFAPQLYLMPLFLTGPSVGVALSILITSITFGLTHLGSSENNDNYIHAITATTLGIISGILAAQFALPGDIAIAAPIAAHIAHNTLCTFLNSLNQPESTEQEHQNPLNNPGL
jgi:membrane protease YdiL (CAAX protease family)